MHESLFLLFSRKEGLSVFVRRLALFVFLALAAAGSCMLWLRPPSVPDETIRTATEAEIVADVPQTLTLFRFAPIPAVLVLDFPTLAEQGRMLNRIAALVEKRGLPHDHLLNDAQLDAAIRAGGDTPDTYYYGHDYPAGEIRRFFALADRDTVSLNADEQRLRRIAAQAAAEPAGLGALISLPSAVAVNGVDTADRAAILHHELSHGEYFTDPIYARYTGGIWSTVLTAEERGRFRAYLGAEGYDTGLEDLMINEMQAYLMHTPDPRFFDPARLGIAAARLAAIREAFTAGMPPSWLRDHPRRRSGQRPGRVSRTMALAARLPPRRRRASIAA